MFFQKGAKVCAVVRVLKGWWQKCDHHLMSLSFQISPLQQSTHSPLISSPAARANLISQSVYMPASFIQDLPDCLVCFAWLSSILYSAHLTCLFWTRAWIHGLYSTGLLLVRFVCLIGLIAGLDSHLFWNMCKNWNFLHVTVLLGSVQPLAWQRQVDSNE